MKFTPDVLVDVTTTCLVTQICEALLMKFGFYIFAVRPIVTPSFLELMAYVDERREKRRGRGGGLLPCTVCVCVCVCMCVCVCVCVCCTWRRRRRRRRRWRDGTWYPCKSVLLLF